MKSYSTLLDRAIEETCAELTTQIQSLTSRAGWPAGISEAVHVVYSGGNFAVVYPESLAASVDVLENGTPDQQPSAVLRRFENAIVRKGGAVFLHFLEADLKKRKVLS